MQALMLIVLLTVGAGPRSTPEGCQEDHGICREDCTIEYGGNMKKYRLLTECLRRCERQVNACRERHYTLQDARRKSEEPASGGDTVRRGVYRVEEAEAREPAKPEEPTTEPAVHTEPEEPTEKLDEASIPIFDEPAPEPPPEPKPQPVPEPAETKKDIADWDPDGD